MKRRRESGDKGSQSKRRIRKWVEPKQTEGRKGEDPARGRAEKQRKKKERKTREVKKKKQGEEEEEGGGGGEEVQKGGGAESTAKRKKRGFSRSNRNEGCGFKPSKQF